jgi:2-(1,2-epoxy-1,2-dihydrophenyl)acetyl-CoA isomerase
MGMTDEDRLVGTELEEGVLTITLNRPKANAFNMEMIDAVRAAFKRADRDSGVRTVLLTGSGRFFSAGQDVSDFQSDEPVSFRRHLGRTYNPLILQIRALEKPVLAGINGTVAGAALGIALACDLRIAAETAQFFVGFLGIGLAPDSAISLLLPGLIGLGRAAEVTFTNRPIQADQALEWGLINRVAPPEKLREQATTWARELARGPIHAMGLAKRDFNKAILPNLADVLDYEAYNQETAGQGEEHMEGLSAFLEKRLPEYM